MRQTFLLTALAVTALILIGPALAQEGFEESRLYAGDYDRRYRPVGTHPRFPGTGS